MCVNESHQHQVDAYIGLHTKRKKVACVCKRIGVCIKSGVFIKSGVCNKGSVFIKSGVCISSSSLFRLRCPSQ